ncbi:hypothetical protein EG329_000984 [Mollisiaceae sp. DMI_Dod_QoI]|nr:hypothetical protein EG329_000984 [Helotiales sp. DMI_Dod_QoI]
MSRTKRRNRRNHGKGHGHTHPHPKPPVSTTNPTSTPTKPQPTASLTTQTHPPKPSPTNTSPPPKPLIHDSDSDSIPAINTSPPLKKPTVPDSDSDSDTTDSIPCSSHSSSEREIIQQLLPNRGQKLQIHADQLAEWSARSAQAKAKAQAAAAACKGQGEGVSAVRYIRGKTGDFLRAGVPDRKAEKGSEGKQENPKLKEEMKENLNSPSFFKPPPSSFEQSEREMSKERQKQMLNGWGVFKEWEGIVDSD